MEPIPGAQLAADDPIDMLRRGIELVLDPRPSISDVQRIALVDAPAVLGYEEWREIEERYGLGLLTGALGAAMEARPGQIPAGSSPSPTFSSELIIVAAQYVARADDVPGRAQEMGAALNGLLDRHRRAEQGISPYVWPMIDELIGQVEVRHGELESMMSDPAVIGDRERYAEVGREYRQLSDAHQLAVEYLHLKDDLKGAREMIGDDPDDPELKKVVAEAPERLEELAEEIRLAMVERDPNDDRNVIVEVRAGTGGDEAALFAGDLYKMLTRYAEASGFTTENLSSSPADVGGFKEATFAIKGDGAYSVFKYEGGTHRVQRVPKTESQGRIHPSTATVAVLPEAEEVDIQLNPGDIDMDTYRSSGPGGQSVNTTDSAVRLTHKPTGIVVSMQDEKSQLQNRERGMRAPRARILEHQLAEQHAKEASERKAQVGSGQRAEKIRTYNVPQDRITDHRVKVTVNNIERVLNGDLDEFTQALIGRGEAPAPGGPDRRIAVSA